MTDTAALASIAVACDPDGRVRRVLRDGLALAGRLPAGAPFATVLDPASADLAAGLFAAVARDGAAFDWEVHAAPTDAGVRPLRCAAVRAGDEVVVAAAPTCAEARRVCDELTGCSDDRAAAPCAATPTAEVPARVSDAMFDEITQLNNELVTTHRELAKANAQLAALNEQKNALLGMAAHDLRNPIGAIEAYSQCLLESDLPFDAEQRECLTTMRDSSLLMLALLEDLLDVAEVESGNLRLQCTATDLAALVAQCAAINRVLAARKSIRITSAVAPDLPPARIDAGKISQVLSNLVTNAVKFSHPGTEVTIALRRAEDALVVSVRDQGQGIPERERDRLFEAFARTSVRPTAGERSTGLGLAIVKRIVTEHGGRIWVESEVGCGSTFSVALPIAAAPTAAAEAPRPGLRILAADDNPVNRRLIGRVLEKLGHVAVVVADGRQAVETWQRGDFDAVLLDLEMPELDGWQAAAAIRAAEGGGARVPILAITGHTDAASQERCRAAGMDGWAPKPLRADTLRVALAAALQGGGAGTVAT